MLTGEAVMAAYRLQDAPDIVPCAFCPLCTVSCPCGMRLPLQILGRHLKTGVKGMSLLTGSGWKKMQVQHHVGLGVEADAHGAEPWTPSALHAAHSQAGGPFLKWAEWHISVLAMLITQDAMPHPVTGVV